MSVTVDSGHILLFDIIPTHILPRLDFIGKVLLSSTCSHFLDKIREDLECYVIERFVQTHFFESFDRLFMVYKYVKPENYYLLVDKIQDYCPKYVKETGIDDQHDDNMMRLFVSCTDSDDYREMFDGNDTELYFMYFIVNNSRIWKQTKKHSTLEYLNQCVGFAFSDTALSSGYLFGEIVDDINSECFSTCTHKYTEEESEKYEDMSSDAKYEFFLSSPCDCVRKLRKRKERNFTYLRQMVETGEINTVTCDVPDTALRLNIIALSVSERLKSPCYYPTVGWCVSKYIQVYKIIHYNKGIEFLEVTEETFNKLKSIKYDLRRVK